MTKQQGILGLLLLWSLSARCAEPWTLERALQQALTANPDARLAQQRIAGAQAGLEQANAARAIADPAVVGPFEKLGAVVLTGMSEDKFRAFIVEDYTRQGDAVRRAGITLD